MPLGSPMNSAWKTGSEEEDGCDDRMVHGIADHGSPGRALVPRGHGVLRLAQARAETAKLPSHLAAWRGQSRPHSEALATPSAQCTSTASPRVMHCRNARMSFAAPSPGHPLLVVRQLDTSAAACLYEPPLRDGSPQPRVRARQGSRLRVLDTSQMCFPSASCPFSW